ncbi:MAG: hypothetical protein KKA32_02865 [Actinobacteria bacterium]|nr:hypothetical protein [Actinomycetota bacterium]
MNSAGYRSIDVSSITLQRGELSKRRRRVKDPQEMKKLLSELPQAEVAQGVSGEGHVPCSIGNSRLVLTLFRKGGGYRTVEIRHGLVYEGTRYLGSLKSPTDRFVAEFLKDARERPINPAAEILRSSRGG